MLKLQVYSMSVFVGLFYAELSYFLAIIWFSR